MNYAAWPPLACGIMILLMLTGGGIGSTAGGIKLTRVYLMLRLAAQNTRQRLTPIRSVEAPYYIKAQGKTRIDPTLAADTTGLVVCYCSIFVGGTLLTTITADCSLLEAMFEFASALGTVGLSVGITSPAAGAGTLIVEMCGMILGRLEIFIVLIGLYTGVTALRQHIGSRGN